ncbi:hypothetical protein PMG11_11171 [Penicillium brasilianum]|uniref:Uncharacterized protein n=1 Tax=Penicillium brasilianum TaxID=104259 RepID=A0A0F7U1D2_PENBI|nr:hypothetical protein PMG11_11171 [Penicillium brasilianum]
MFPIFETFENSPPSEIDEQVVDALRLLDSIDHGPLLDMEPEEKRLLYKSEIERDFREVFEELDSDEAFEVCKQFQEYRLNRDLGLPIKGIYQKMKSVEISEEKRRKLVAILVFHHAVTLKHGKMGCF